MEKVEKKNEEISNKFNEISKKFKLMMTLEYSMDKNSTWADRTIGSDAKIDGQNYKICNITHTGALWNTNNGTIKNIDFVFKSDTKRTSGIVDTNNGQIGIDSTN